MRALARLFALAGVLAFGLAPDPEWHVAREPGDGCWPPRCEDGQVPLATPVVAHAGRLFMIGDGAAPDRGYESTDGQHWRGFTHDARWGKRYKAADASYARALWRVGGWVEENGTRTPMNDVWRSEDGRRWQRVLARAAWPPRSGAHLVVLRDTLWLVGGEPNDQRIWRTTDGRSWTGVSTPSLPRKNPQGVLVYRNALWILGHGDWASATNDVWTSTDGEAWTRVTESADWPARTAAGFAVLNDRLWAVAGAGNRDAWSSADGRTWLRAAAELPGPPRGADYSVVFQSAYWVFGGKTGGLGGTGFWDGVAYFK
jgi:hypothetical protein